MYKKVRVQPYPFISCRFVQIALQIYVFSAAYFMSGVRPIEMIV